MKKQLTYTLLIAAIIHIGLAQDLKSSKELVLASDIEWTPLNPARGDNSPKAGNIWGDRTKEGATGFLVQFKKGFSSPPHIHNVTYRGIVLNGKVHNDDPEAANLWMPAGSYWTQPAGEAHITSADGDFNMAYIEIQDGPYLVKPTDQAFDNGERPINMEVSNMPWIRGDEITWVKNKAVYMARLWNDSSSELETTLVKLPAGFEGSIVSKADDFKSVVIQGTIKYESQQLEPGSYFGSKGNVSHQLATDGESMIYIRSKGDFEITEQ
ncbi:DUF4437 domain-containing protein [Ekhidna sp.]|jgi:quercetin dioxygenase-like cupin family protein|uniref:DUF4437 domain-containing protein n=1 Tax=Ekhidna sp. TaxID=2608089 RepID=UPI0032EE6223